MKLIYMQNRRKNKDNTIEMQFYYTTSQLASWWCYFLNWYSTKMFKTSSYKWDMSTYHMFFFSEFSIKKHEIF